MYVVYFLYLCVCTYTCLILEKKKHWWSLVSSWPDELEKVGQPEKNILKRKYKTTDKLLNFCIYISYDYFDILSCLSVYICI